MNPIKEYVGLFTNANPIANHHGIILCTLKDQLVDGLFKYPHFLWFDLGRPDIWITIIAGVL